MKYRISLFFETDAKLPRINVIGVEAISDVLEHILPKAFHSEEIKNSLRLILEKIDD